MSSPGELPGSANLARYFQTPSTLPPLQPLLPLSQLRICCADNKTTSSLGLAMQKRRPTRALKLESYDRAQQSSSPRPNNSFSSDVDCTEEFMLATPGSCAGRETRAVKKKSRQGELKGKVKSFQLTVAQSAKVDGELLTNSIEVASGAEIAGSIARVS